jgi:hypothetical protein
MVEMQRAVTLAERRALESVASERIKMERLLMEAASVSRVSGSISSTSSMGNIKSRKPDLNILETLVNPERLDKEEKLAIERVKHDEDNHSSLQGIRQNDVSNVDECVRDSKNKVSSYRNHPNLFSICLYC